MRASSSAARAGWCRICAGGVTPGYTVCPSCRDVAVALGRPPVPVAPVALVTVSSPLYRALRQYKSGEHAVASRQRLRLAAMLEGFVERHGRSVAACHADLTVVVPSPRGGRPPPHPLVGVIEAAGSLPPVLDVLSAGDERVEHRRPSPGGYRVTADIEGSKVLLVDDLYTSGAHLQSAAVALADAGAAAVHALVLGRFVRDGAGRSGCPRCGLEP